MTAYPAQVLIILNRILRVASEPSARQRYFTRGLLPKVRGGPVITQQYPPSSAPYKPNQVENPTMLSTPGRCDLITALCMIGFPRCLHILTVHGYQQILSYAYGPYVPIVLLGRMRYVALCYRSYAKTLRGRTVPFLHTYVDSR